VNDLLLLLLQLLLLSITRRCRDFDAVKALADAISNNDKTMPIPAVIVSSLVSKSNLSKPQ
jgi:hypothetical protein